MPGKQKAETTPSIVVFPFRISRFPPLLFLRSASRVLFADGNKKTPIPMARDERCKLAVPPLLPPRHNADDHSGTPLPLDLQERMAVLVTGNNPDPIY
jgi:hypothetical protein